MIPIIDGQIPVHRPASLLCTLLCVEIYPGKAKYQAKHEVGIPDSFMHLIYINPGEFSTTIVIKVLDCSALYIASIPSV